MNLTEFALKNSRVTLLVTLILAVSGLLLYLNFPSKEDPEVTVREAVAAAYFPGMSPGRVENLITRKIEKAVRRIPEVKRITNSSKTGMSITHVVVYDKYFDLEPIWQDLRNKMNDVKAELPRGTIGPMVNSDFGDVFVGTVALTASGFSQAEMHAVAKRIRDDMYTVQGVKRVELHGVQPERVYLEVTNARLATYGLTPDTLVQTLVSQNIISPGGKIEADGKNYVVEPTGNFRSIEDIAETVIRLPDRDGVAYLRDVVTIRRAYLDPPESAALFNGKPAIIVAISMEKGRNVLDLGPHLQEKVKEIQDGLPYGYSLDFATYQATFVRKSVDGVALNVYETIGIVLAMVMVFLGLRTGLIVGSIVPLTMLVTLVFMRLLDIELERVSLATLIIALGLLVDNGVVIAEDIQRRLGLGEDRWNAALGTGKQLALPLLTSSFTTILAFMPLMMADNSAGEYMRSMSLVVLITLLSSWVLAMCVTPLLCLHFLPKPKKTPAEIQATFDNRMYTAYKAILRFVLRIRWLFVAAIAAGLVGGFALLGTVPQQFFPESQRNQFLVDVDLPAGYGTRASQKTISAITQWLGDKTKNPEVLKTVAYVGYGGPRIVVAIPPRDADPNVGFVMVTTKSTDDVGPAMMRLRKYAAANHPEAKLRIKRFFLGNSETGLMEVRIRGTNIDLLERYGHDMMAALRDIAGTIDIRNNWENRITKIEVVVDQARARRAGVTSQEIAGALNAYFSGEAITDYREGDRIIPLVLRATAAERFNIDRLRSIDVYSAARETSVPLTQVADFEVVNQPSRIERRNLQRTITISAKHSWMTAEELQQAAMPAIEKMQAGFPPGFTWEFGGETADAAEANEALFQYVPHALAAMIILLVWQFNSFAKPAIIFITIPISFIGAAVGLKLSGANLGFMATLGFLSLSGIIINNAIVLLDEIQTQIDAGQTPYDAAIGASVARFGPVMLTTLTTILGLLTLMLPPDPLFFAMAIVIACGLAMGTILTLLTVPVLYTIFFRVPIPKGTRGDAAKDGAAAMLEAAA
ncbi:MAG: efflux RND transporter permease subunit [Alphaproteobacteria bacterium]|nr:efflux RND transporter permease subunit [Alphaproteobacteria bacterium]